MFEFRANPEFSWPVKVQTPQPDGTFAEERFTAQWQVQNSAELNAYQVKHPKGAIAALFEKALKGWSDISVDGSPMAFTAENVDLLANTPHVAAALVASYWDAVNGKLHEKN